MSRSFGRAVGPVRIVLLPGIRGDAHEWDALRPWLPADTVAVDLPAVDRSGADLFEHAAALSPALPDGPIVVVGASFGGLIGWALSVREPARVRRLVTIGTLPGPTAASRRAGWSAPLVRRLPQRLYTELYGARAAADWLADDPDPERYAALRLPSPRVLASRLGAIGRWGLPKRVPVPTAFVWGATDRYVTWAHAEVEALGAEAGIVPGGHRPHLSHPAEVAAWVRSAAGLPTGRGSA